MGLADNAFYTWYGDSAYGGFYHCIRKRHEEGQGAAPLTVRQRTENCAMKRVQITIEWSYALVTKLWKEANNWQMRKLDVDPQLVAASLCVHFLVTNMYICCHESQTANFFELSPPSLEEYLGIIN
jgi:hypothetical protein